MVGLADNYMVEHFHFEKLPGADEVAGEFNIRLGRRRVAARVVVLCGAPVYVQSPLGETGFAGSTAGGKLVKVSGVPPVTKSPPIGRVLKIEADGDTWKGLIKPKIRLMGRWLERAGFSPGRHVHVTCIAPGVIELRSSDASTVKETRPASSEQPQLPS